MTSFSNALVAANDMYDLELLLMLIQQINPPHQQFTALAASPALSPLPVVGRQQEIGPRPHRDAAADGLFNISATTFGSPLGRPRPPPCSLTQPWSLPLAGPAAYNLPGFPPIPPQLILWDGIVMQIKDA